MGYRVGYRVGYPMGYRGAIGRAIRLAIGLAIGNREPLVCGCLGGELERHGLAWEGSGSRARARTPAARFEAVAHPQRASGHRESGTSAHAPDRVPLPSVAMRRAPRHTVW